MGVTQSLNTAGTFECNEYYAMKVGVGEGMVQYKMYSRDNLRNPSYCDTF